jgi:uncharacterized protein YjbJ (UPF0337 family)
MPQAGVFTLQPGGPMSWDGTWNKIKGEVRENLGKLTDDDMEQAAGSRDKLIGRIQDRYGYSRDEAEKRLDEVSRAANA